MAENLAQVPKDGDALSTFSNAATSIHHATEERQSFKWHLTVKPTQEPGEVCATFQLDRSVAPDFLNCYEYFTFEDLVVDLQSVAPFGTASGGIMAAYLSDPLNTSKPELPIYNIDRFGVTEGTIVVRAKDSKKVTIPAADSCPIQGKWRYTNNGGNQRQSSFGSIYFVTLDPPAPGDGSRWEAWVRGYAVGRRRTQVTDGNLMSYHAYVNPERDTTITMTGESPNYTLNVEVPIRTAEGHKGGWYPDQPNVAGSVVHSWWFGAPIYKRILLATADQEEFAIEQLFQSGTDATASSSYGGYVTVHIPCYIPDYTGELTVLTTSQQLFSRYDNCMFSITTVGNNAQFPPTRKAERTTRVIRPSKSTTTNCLVMGKHSTAPHTPSSSPMHV
jgi:hypothetical protein